MKKTFSFYLVTFITLLLYVSSVFWTATDINYEFRWYQFFLWIVSLITLPLFLLYKHKTSTITHVKEFFTEKKKIILFALLLFLSIIFSFAFLKAYPFVALYDQVRDGGLNGYEIATGMLKTIFGYGRYASHGTIIPTITSFFFYIFGHSVYTYRVPDAFLTIIGAILIFFLIRKTVNLQTAFWAGLTLVTSPLYLYYGRTEIVVMFSAFLTCAILFALFFWQKNKTIPSYILFGLLLGFSSGFHTSLRTVALFTSIVVFVWSILSSIKNKSKTVLIGLLFLSLGYLIGFGPRILFTTPDIFFQTRTLSPNQHTSLSHLFDNYQKSLLVYISEPTMSTHYPDFKPILPPFLGILFVIGIITVLFSEKKFFLKVLLLYALFLPFSNSTLTDTVNADHRLGPLFPLAAIFVANGIDETLQLFAIKKYLRPIGISVQLFFFVFILFQGILFFLNEPANKAYGVQDYLSMHTVYALQENKQYQKLSNFCFFVSPATLEYFKLLHVQEQYNYFLPGKTITVIEQPEIPQNQLFVSSSCNFSDIQHRSQPIVYCNPTEKFLCPKNSLLVNFIESPNQATPLPAGHTNMQESVVIPPKPAVIP